MARIRVKTPRIAIESYVISSRTPISAICGGPSRDESRRERILNRLEQFEKESRTYLNASDNEHDQDEVYSLNNDDSDSYADADADADDSDDADDNQLKNIFQDPITVESSTVIPPERLSIPIPSNLGIDFCRKNMLIHLVDAEIVLQKGQANDALHQIRISLVKKAYIFRTTVRHAHTQQRKTRVWRDINASENSIRGLRRIYTCARSAMIRLGVPPDIMKQYQVLEKDHLKATTAVMDPDNISGHRQGQLAWFWNIEQLQHDQDGNWMEECKIVL